MKNSSELTRLKKVLLSDNIRVPNGVAEILKADLFSLLNSYFDVRKDSVKLEINVDESGVYNIAVYSSATGVKSVKSL